MHHVGKDWTNHAGTPTGSRHDEKTEGASNLASLFPQLVVGMD